MNHLKIAIGAFIVAGLPIAAFAATPEAVSVPPILAAQGGAGPTDKAPPAQAPQVPAALQAQAAAAADRDRAEAFASSSARITSTSSASTSSAPSTVPMNMPPPIRLVSPSAALSAKERHGVALARRWRNRGEMPQPGEDGVVRFLYGATMPSVVCAPLMVCDLALQPGEVVQNLNIGDSVRWKVSPAFSGLGDTRETHVIIKPTDAGLVTDMILSTTRRVYSIKLISTQHEWMPLVAFNYPDDVKAQWAAYQQTASFGAAAATLVSGESAADLDFNYQITGDDPAWKPIRVYTDGSKTYIEFSPAAAHQPAPALVALANDGTWFSSPTPQIINYRQMGNRYIVDSVLTKAALISGVGSDQTRVTITKGAL